MAECPNCANEVTDTDDEEWGDDNYDDDCDSASYAEYTCGVCGCMFTSGTKTVYFTDVNEEGDPRFAENYDIRNPTEDNEDYEFPDNYKWNPESHDWEGEDWVLTMYQELFGISPHHPRDTWICIGTCLNYKQGCADCIRRVHLPKAE